ncbi:hypothetical protein D0863_15997 [Hortaea werneckii]|uniref:tRNA pseudouridine(55) synthase n=1 Tax=Hortaea werneckii TaxID=91943 RepID=A0A3M7C0Z6_HORWE|nr:hypothetical protein D0863_15997 [Hortaea werneckii]
MRGSHILRQTIRNATPSTMSPPSPPSGPILEGVFAINKPRGITSAQVIRDVQSHFNPSALFQPWLRAERARRDRESHNQKQKRRSWKQRQPIQVKIGHGGTLDPLATGVLILGIGAGTKRLNEFLECTKSYETVLLFGAATDSYDTEGKIVARKPYGHVTREVVEEKVKAFRGKIMQKPPIFSAKRIQGKRLYEYAREGKSLPEGYQIEECPVDVKELEVLEWLEGGKHGFAWPGTEAEGEEKRLVDEVLGLEDQGNEATKQGSVMGKRKRDGEDEKQEAREEETVGGAVTADDGSLPAPPSPKRAKAAPQPSEETPVVSGALPKEPSIPESQGAAADSTPTTENPANATTTSPDHQRCRRRGSRSPARRHRRENGARGPGNGEEDVQPLAGTWEISGNPTLDKCQKRCDRDNPRKLDKEYHENRRERDSCKDQCYYLLSGEGNWQEMGMGDAHEQALKDAEEEKEDEKIEGGK